MIPTESYSKHFDRLVNLWERAYMVICPSMKSLESRLFELGNWDKGGTKIEHDAKEAALQNLIMKLKKRKK